MTDRPYYVALSQAPGIGEQRFKILLQNFDSAESVWKAKDNLLREILGPKTYENFNQFRQTTDPIKYLNKIEDQDIAVLTLLDPDYPARLQEIFDPPSVIYVKGEIKPEDNQALGVVGSRKVTGYGQEVTEIIVSQLASSGLTIVSGLARGVDSLAHKTALKNGKRTIAVLGSGVNVIYPPENINLAKEIIKNGAVISELHPDTQPSQGYFPARNRIISGLSLGVLVTEASEDSGSLITASCALEQNREVFAVPGPIYSKMSKGPAELIKQGAKLVTSADDILDELNLKKSSSSPKIEIKGETADEQSVIDCLQDENKHIDQIIRETQVPAEKMSGLIMTMEIKGQVKHLGAGTYSLPKS